MDPWRLKVLADFQSERLEALLREKRVRRALRDRPAGARQRKPGFKWMLVLMAVAAKCTPHPPPGCHAAGAMLTAIAPGHPESPASPVPVYDAIAAMWTAVPGLKA